MRAETKPASKSTMSNAERVVFCVFAILINMIGVLIVSLLHIPLYLDTIGTITVSVCGGYLPGIIVGFFTNLIKGTIKSEHMYYALINMLTAVITSYFARKGYYKSNVKPFITVPILAAVTGIPGGILTWFLNNSSMGGVGGDFAASINSSMGLGEFPSQMISDCLTEFADKLISVLVVVLLLKILPKRIRNIFKASRKWQADLTAEMAKEIRNSKCRSVSIRTKILLILTIASILIAGTSIVISSVIYKNNTIEEHKKLAKGAAALAASSVNADMVDKYIEKGALAEGYTATEQQLYRLKERTPDIQFVYVYKIEEDGCHVVFDLDTEEFEGGRPGDVVPFDKSFEKYVPDLLEGKRIEPMITDDTYGWLLTVYEPVYNRYGVCKCYAAVDISMNLLSKYSYSFIAKILSLLIGFFILILAICMWLVENNIIMPINTMAYCAGAFAYNSDTAREESVERLKEINIRTGDEVENLYHSFVKTTEESMQYVSDIQQKTQTISEMQNGLILVLADMVESRDKCTGDHVKKTAAYVNIIMNEMKKQGIYADRLSDEFVHDVVNAAPLHDIGKIHVSDVILNKPGKLTDEEFAIMKSHTYLGSEIIERAIDMVPDSGYLEEAKNLSEFHHEKWNGRGYPHGLSGEDIPLSARIMAVADVFDALVSRRSYKQPFTFEKAMSIIKEDAGTHFDPEVVKAFVSAEDEVRRVAENFEQMN